VFKNVKINAQRNKDSKFRDVNPLDIVVLALQVHSHEVVPCDVTP
jgi:hypothetical protein